MDKFENSVKPGGIYYDTNGINKASEERILSFTELMLPRRLSRMKSPKNQYDRLGDYLKVNHHQTEMS